MALVQTHVVDYPAAEPSSQPAVQMKLQNMTSQPPGFPKPKARVRMDPQRALEPARKKLSTVEAQRIMAVLTDCIRKIELTSIIPGLCEDPSRFSVSLGAELLKMLENHRVIMKSYEELETSTQTYLEKEVSQEGRWSAAQSRPGSGSSTSSQANSGMRSLALVARQMQQSCKNIVRAFARDPAAMANVLKIQLGKNSENMMIGELEDLRDIVMGMLLTTPIEEMQRNLYLKEVSERERYNAAVIQKLETELVAALDDKDQVVNILLKCLNMFL